MNADPGVNVESAWQRIAMILRADPLDDDLKRRMRMAASKWQDYNIDDFAPSMEMKNDLKQVAIASKQFERKAKRIRSHIQMHLLLYHNKIPISEDDNDNPFSDEHLEAIKQIGVLCDMLSKTMTTTRGPKGEAPRRASWIEATDIFEKEIGRPATFGRNADGQISGPWVDFICAFCAFAMPGHVPENGAIEAFHKQRSRTLKEGRDPLSELIFGA